MIQCVCFVCAVCVCVCVCALPPFLPPPPPTNPRTKNPKAAAKTKRGDFPLPKLLEVTDTGSLGITGSKVNRLYKDTGSLGITGSKVMKMRVYPTAVACVVVCCCALCAAC